MRGNHPGFYEAVGAPRRSIVCRYLAETGDDVVTLEEVATTVATEERTTSTGSATAGSTDDMGSASEDRYTRRVAIELHHVHLPKLEEAGVCTYDHEQHLVRTGPGLAAAIEYVERVDNAATEPRPDP